MAIGDFGGQILSKQIRYIIAHLSDSDLPVFNGFWSFFAVRSAQCVSVSALHRKHRFAESLFAVDRMLLYYI